MLITRTQNPTFHHQGTDHNHKFSESVINLSDTAFAPMELEILQEGHKHAMVPTNRNNYLQAVLASDIASTSRMGTARNIPMLKHYIHNLDFYLLTIREEGALLPKEET